MREPPTPCLSWLLHTGKPIAVPKNLMVTGTLERLVTCTIQNSSSDTAWFMEKDVQSINAGSRRQSRAVQYRPDP